MVRTTSSEMYSEIGTKFWNVINELANAIKPLMWGLSSFCSEANVQYAERLW